MVSRVSDAVISNGLEYNQHYRRKLHVKMVRCHFDSDNISPWHFVLFPLIRRILFLLFEFRNGTVKMVDNLSIFCALCSSAAAHFWKFYAYSVSESTLSLICLNGQGRMEITCDRIRLMRLNVNDRKKAEEADENSKRYIFEEYRLADSKKCEWAAMKRRQKNEMKILILVVDVF